MSAQTKWWHCGHCGFPNHPRANQDNEKCEQCGWARDDDDATDYKPQGELR